MKAIVMLLAVTATVVAARRQAEPAPRALVAQPIEIKTELGAVAGVRELANGQLLVSDAGAVAIFVIDPATGESHKLGRQGQGPNEFGKPGGIYYDADGVTSLIVDRSQPRVLVVDKTGTLTGMRSIEQRGVSRSSDGTDPQRIDAALHTYFVDQGFLFRPQGASPDSLPLLRFDVTRQRAETAAKIFRTKPTVISAKDRVTMSRTPVFSPADGWAVASDGSIALVRAVPYRVDWVSAGGQSSVGTPIAYAPVPVTDADRQAREGGDATSMSIGSKGGRGTGLSGADFKPEYAKVKPAFDPDAIVMSPDSRVWVSRYLPASAKQVVYDVFDRRGGRVDRVAFPARSRVVGFGPNAVFAAELDDDDVPKLRKYRLTR